MMMAADNGIPVLFDGSKDQVIQSGRITQGKCRPRILVGISKIISEEILEIISGKKMKIF